LYGWAVDSGETALVEGAVHITQEDIKAFQKKIGFTEE
jgi:hypothetical protein